LLVHEIVLFIAEIGGEEAVAAIAAVIEERNIRTLPAVIGVPNLETGMTVDQILGELALVGKHAKLAVLKANVAIAVPDIFAIGSGMGQVAIP
jgi:hypothetical protein